MKILILADMNDFHWDHGTGNVDLVISCGDMYDDVILEAAESYKALKVLAVKGNHDSEGDFPDPIIDLHLNIVRISGVTFGGFNGAWQYKNQGFYMYSQDEVKDLLGSFPPVDIFISHNSPRGVHDRDDGVHYGFEAFNDYIEKCKPKLFIHGHQHVNKETKIGDTKVIGVHGYKIFDRSQI